MRIHAACNMAIRQQEVEVLKASDSFMHIIYIAQLDGFDIKPFTGVLFVFIIVLTSITTSKWKKKEM